jgi:hypothetical protein
MTVHYTGGGGGLFGTLARAAGLAANFIPGMQPFAPVINAASSLANGDVGGAIGGVVGGVVPGIQAANKLKETNQGSLLSALQNAAAVNSPSANMVDPSAPVDFNLLQGAFPASPYNQQADPQWRRAGQASARRRF